MVLFSQPFFFGAFCPILPLPCFIVIFLILILRFCLIEHFIFFKLYLQKQRWLQRTCISSRFYKLQSRDERRSTCKMAAAGFVRRGEQMRGDIAEGKNKMWLAHLISHRDPRSVRWHSRGARLEGKPKTSKGVTKWGWRYDEVKNSNKKKKFIFCGKRRCLSPRYLPHESFFPFRIVNNIDAAQSIFGTKQCTDHPLWLLMAFWSAEIISSHISSWTSFVPLSIILLAGTISYHFLLPFCLRIAIFFFTFSFSYLRYTFF